MGITRYSDIKGKGTYDVFSDGRRYAYYEGTWFNEMVVRIDVDDTTSLITPFGAEWDEIEEPAKDPNLKLDGMHTMDDATYATWALVLWYEMFCWPQLSATLGLLNSPREEKVIQMEAVMIAWWFDPSTVNALAINMIDNGIKPKFSEVGITMPPINFIRLALGQ